MERLREDLAPQFEVLEALQRRATLDIFGPDETNDISDPAAFDALDEDETGFVDTHTHATRANVAAQGTGTDIGVEPPEGRRLSIPSTWISRDNPYRAKELELRIQQASKTLQILRDKIADKSFQYSHIIRVAPRKGVRTRARATIAKLNHAIAYLCRVYSQCRAAMTRLGADNQTLDTYQILLREHVKSSTAMLNPNEPGSTHVQLSWIWQTGAPGNDGTPPALRECRLSISLFI